MAKRKPPAPPAHEVIAAFLERCRKHFERGILGYRAAKGEEAARMFQPALEYYRHAVRAIDWCLWLNDPNKVQGGKRKAAADGDS